MRGDQIGALSIGNAYNPALKKAAEFGTDVLNGLAECIDENPARVNAIGAAAGTRGGSVGGLAAVNLSPPGGPAGTSPGRAAHAGPPGKAPVHPLPPPPCPAGFHIRKKQSYRPSSRPPERRTFFSLYHKKKPRCNRAARML